MIDTDALVETEIDRVITQYRESPKLLFLIRTYLGQVAEVIDRLDDIPGKFDINTATGDQLTLLGKRLGWPRCHCICITQPVFGFNCPDLPSDFPLVGFCEPGTWVDCGDFGVGDICITDDELYRGFLLARRYQILSLYDRDSLTDALRAMWGPTAWIVDDGNGSVTMSPGRVLTATETAFLQLVPRVLPVASGIKQRFHFGTNPIFGFGDGWGGFCQPNGDEVFIIDDDGADVIDDDGAPLTDYPGSDTLPLVVGESPLYTDADWICAVDLRPYSCPEIF